MNKRTVNRIAWVGPQGRSYRNIRYAALLPRLTNVDKTYIDLPGFWAARALLRRIWLPAVTVSVGRRYPWVFSTDWHQVSLLRAKVILDMDDPFFTPDEVSALNRPNVAAVVVTLEAMRKRYAGLGVRTPIEVIPQGVDLFPATAVDVRRLRGQSGAGRDSIVVGLHQPKLILSGGRHSEAPDPFAVDPLLKIMEHARAKKTGLVLWLIGEPDSALQEYAARHPWVKLLGFHDRSRLMNLVSAFDIGVFPRRPGPLLRSNIKILDYMAGKVPVVGYDSPGMEPAVSAGAGFAVPDDRQFEKALLRLAASPALRRGMGEKGYRAVRRFTWDLVADRYRNFLDRTTRPEKKAGSAPAKSVPGRKR